MGPGILGVKASTEQQRRLSVLNMSGVSGVDCVRRAQQLSREYREVLLRDGILLLGGFDLNHSTLGLFASEFSGRGLFDYAGGVSPRVNLNKGVYSSTEYPPDLRLSLHNEMSYTAVYPRNLFFYCAAAPAVGGETTYGDSRRILRTLSPDIRRRFQAKGVRYDRHLSGIAGSGYSWQEAFATGDRSEVEFKCSAAGGACQWSADGSLRISEVRPATTHHPETGEEVWFNQADGFHADEYNGSDFVDPRLDSCYGDGTPLEPDVLAEIRRAVEIETVPHAWRAGDLLVLDNVLAAHGRAPFQGSRRILLAMT